MFEQNFNLTNPTANEQLQQSLKKLHFVSLPSEFGLSEIFHQSRVTEQAVLVACETAMQQLAEDYTSCLEQMNSTQEPEQQMALFERAELIWQECSSTILQHDSTGEEAKFLTKMRLSALQFSERQFSFACQKFELEPTATQRLLCETLISGIDQMMDEIGYQENSHHRLRHRNLMKYFSS